MVPRFLQGREQQWMSGMVTLPKVLLVEEAGVPECALQSLCYPQEKSPWREAALCWEAISLSGQGKKWGISSLVRGADFSTGGSSSFSNSPDWCKGKNSRGAELWVRGLREQQRQRDPQASSP